MYNNNSLLGLAMGDNPNQQQPKQYAAMADKGAINPLAGGSYFSGGDSAKREKEFETGEFRNVKGWAERWMSSPEYKRRFIQNMGGTEEQLADLQKTMQGVKYETPDKRLPYMGYYDDVKNTIVTNTPNDFLERERKNFMAHELGHVTYRPQKMSQQVKDEFMKLESETPSVGEWFGRTIYPRDRIPEEMGAQLSTIRRMMMEGTGKDTFDDNDMEWLKSNYFRKNRPAENIWSRVPLKKLKYFLNTFVSNSSNDGNKGNSLLDLTNLG